MNQLKEIQQTLAVVTEIKDWLALAASPSIMTINESAANNILSKLESRLKKEKIKVIVAENAGYQLATAAGAITSGTLAEQRIDLVDTMQRQKPQVEAVKMMVVALSKGAASKGKDQAATTTTPLPSTIETISKALADAEAVEFKFDTTIRAEIFRRTLAHCTHQRDYLLYASLMQPEDSNGMLALQHNDIGLWSIFDDEQKSAEQAKRICDDIMGFFRSEDDPKNLVSFMEALREVKLLDDTLKLEVDHLNNILPGESKTEQQLRAARDFFKKADVSKPHKGVTVLPLGQALLRQVAVVLDVFEKDRQAGKLAVSILACLDKPVGEPGGASQAAINSYVNGHAALYARVIMMFTGTSDQLKESHKTLQQKADAFFDEVSNKILATLLAPAYAAALDCTTAILQVLEDSAKLSCLAAPFKKHQASLAKEVACQLAGLSAEKLSVHKFLRGDIMQPKVSVLMLCKTNSHVDFGACDKS